MKDYKARITVEIMDGNKSIEKKSRWMAIGDEEPSYREFEYKFLKRLRLKDKRLLAVFNGLLCLKEIKEDE